MGRREGGGGAELVSIHDKTASEVVSNPRQKKKMLVSLLSWDHCDVELRTARERESHAGQR